VPIPAWLISDDPHRVLVDELVLRAGAEWADFAVCHHPSTKR
jgi:hypothetical protein